MYTYSAFSSVTSTPINLAITIFTSLTREQTTTGSLLGESSSTGIGIATLILSVINAVDISVRLKTCQVLKKITNTRLCLNM